MRELSKAETRDIAGGLAIIQQIPDEQLEALAAIYETTLAEIRRAIAARDADKRRQAEIRARVVQARAAYADQCLMLVRIQRRRKLRPAMLCRLVRPDASACDVRDMLKTGRRIARERKAAAKRCAILEGHARGIGPRPLARQIAARFGQCSPAYVCKVVKEEMQRELPLRHLRAV